MADAREGFASRGVGCARGMLTGTMRAVPGFLVSKALPCPVCSVCSVAATPSGPHRAATKHGCQ